jgi:hypothetical protein
VTARDSLEIVSHCPGRLRVRAETFRVLPDVGEAVSQQLGTIDGVIDAQASAVTGSVLVRYEPAKVELPRLVALIVRLGGLHGLLLEVADDFESKPPPGAHVRRVLDALDRRVRRASAGRLDLRVAVPAALAGTGLAIFLGGRRRVPEWYDLLFWGFVAFCNMNPRAPDESHGQPRE